MMNHDFCGVDNVSGWNSTEIIFVPKRADSVCQAKSLEPNAAQHFVARDREAEEAERNEKHFSGQVQHETFQLSTVKLPKLILSSFRCLCVLWGRVGVLLG